MLTNSFEGVRESLPPMRKWVRDSLNVLVDSSRIDHSLILIAVGEVLQNCIRYGFEANSVTGSVSVNLYQMPYGLGLDVDDTASPSDPSLWVSSKDASEGGLGLTTIESAASAVTYTPLKSGNRARLIFVDNSFALSRETAAWIGDIFLCRQKPCGLAHNSCIAMGEFLEPWHEQLFKVAEDEILAHIKCHQSRLFYHNEWHIQDVVISTGHLLRANKKLDQEHRLACVLSAMFHDHLHPGAFALANLSDPIEKTSALAASKFLDRWFSSRKMNQDSLVSLCSKLILSTQPAVRDRLSVQVTGADLSCDAECELIINDADILASLLNSLGPSLAKAMKFESLDTSHNSADLYDRFVSGVQLKSSFAAALINGAGPDFHSSKG